MAISDSLITKLTAKGLFKHRENSRALQCSFHVLRGFSVLRSTGDARISALKQYVARTRNQTFPFHSWRPRLYLLQPSR